jgi:hypothetical protein
MQRSYISSTTINFIDFNFYVRPGDLLVHDTVNHNRLTVYRNGQIVKVVRQDPIGIVAFLKNKFITEVAPTPTPSVEGETEGHSKQPKSSGSLPVTVKSTSKRDKESIDKGNTL